MYNLFDVGANSGTDSLDKTRDNLNIQTYAFEPTPELCKQLKDNSKNYSDRYHLFEIALSDFDGEAEFNIGDNPNCDWGSSSLLEFIDNKSQVWPNRPDLNFNRSITVRVNRFDTWYEENNLHLDKIDYFHCDTQGSDLKVLQGMGKYIDLIQEGVVECATNENTLLYKNSHTIEQMNNFLNQNGFIVYRKTQNEPLGNEFNLFFRKK